MAWNEVMKISGKNFKQYFVHEKKIVANKTAKMCREEGVYARVLPYYKLNGIKKHGLYSVWVCKKK